MNGPPQSAADPRPNNEPYYIDTECTECGFELLLYDEWRRDVPDSAIRDNKYLGDPDLDDRGGKVWHDEWICPNCLDGVHMDWPDGMWEELVNREPATGTTIEELLNE